MKIGGVLLLCILLLLHVFFHKKEREDHRHTYMDVMKKKKSVECTNKY